MMAQFMRDGQTAEEAGIGVEALVDIGANLSAVIDPQIFSAIVWMAIGALLVVALEWFGHQNAKA